MICHTVPEIAQEAAGPSYSVVRLCESLVEVRGDVTLLSLDASTGKQAVPFLKTFERGVGPYRLGRSPDMMRWLDKQARMGGMDIVHNHSLWMMPNVYPGVVCRKYGIPLVVSPRGTLSEWAFASGSKVKPLFWRFMQKPALAATAMFHATAFSEYEDIRRMGFTQPVAIIPNGIDIPEIGEPLARPGRTLLFLGRINRIKGLDLLLPAWAALQDRFLDWRLRIVGPDSGGYLAEVRQLADELQLERVEFVGALYGKEKWQAYRDADLFVLPTYSENFGMSVAESLAAGTPAVVSKGAPWSGLDVHGAGRWIEVGVEPLVASLENLLAADSAVLRDMGQRGRSWMQAEYSWSGVGQQMNAAYAWILNAASKPDCVMLD